MKKGIIGKKLGMTQVFLEDGNCIPVTVVQAGPCVVTQKKTKSCDGYNAVQVGFESIADLNSKKANAWSFLKNRPRWFSLFETSLSSMKKMS